MKLILHIGSHKTATTSIQHFCALNRDALQSCGYFYPRNRDSAYVFNFLASQVAFGKEKQTARFLQQAHDDAKAAQCHTVVISAESFYAMTAFFWDIQGKDRNIGYWEHEAAFVDKVKQACSSFEAVRISCYLRPQDEFASSIYNQFVKNTIGIAATFEDCIQTIKPIFDYDHHIRLWENAFGQDNIVVKNFTAIQKNIVQDFCDTFLSSDCFAKAQKKDFMANTRLSRDVLEYKRIYNRALPDRPMAFVAARCIREEVSPLFRDKPGYQIFTSRAVSEDLFGEYADGNRDVSSRYKLGDLPPVAGKEEPTYPGLSTDMEAEIRLRLNFLINKPVNRMEISARRLAGFIMKHLPGGKQILAPVRVLQHRIRLQISGW